MSDSQTGPSKRTIIDALVLACQHSPIADVVGTDALRSVLEVEYRELTSDGSFNLQAVWELFEDQPGFEPEAAIGPLCRFKSWERQLGIEIALPNQLRNLTHSEQATYASECEVPSKDLQAILRTGKEQAAADAAPKTARKERARTRQPTLQPVPEDPPERTTSRRKVIQLAAGVVALAGFALAGISVYQGCGDRADWESVSTASLGEIPVARAEKIGDQVRATLSNNEWLSKSDEEREQDLGDALGRLGQQGISVLYVRDQSGTVRAIAQYYDKRSKMRFIFK